MVGAFELYKENISRADGGEFTYQDVKSYLDTIDNEAQSFNVSTNSELKKLICDAIKESNEDKIVFSMFNHDFFQSEVAAINMVLNILALIIAVVMLIKKIK